MRDGSIDAFFWSGGVPTGAITDLATTDKLRLLALDRYLPAMRERFGESYEKAEIEADEYSGVPAVATIGVPNMLMVNADMDDQLAFDITKLLYDNKAALSEVHPSAETLDPKTGREVVEPGGAASRRRALLRGDGAVRRPRAIWAGLAASGALAAVAVGLWAWTARGDGALAVVVRDADGAAVTTRALGPDGGFALAYRHSMYRAPAEERFAVEPGGGLRLTSIASPSQAVLDYYAIEGRQTRGADGAWVLRPDVPPPASERLALAADRGRPANAGHRRTPHAAVARRRPRGPPADHGGGRLMATSAQPPVETDPDDRSEQELLEQYEAERPGRHLHGAPQIIVMVLSAGCRSSRSCGCSTRSRPRPTARRSSPSRCC